MVAIKTRTRNRMWITRTKMPKINPEVAIPFGYLFFCFLAKYIASIGVINEIINKGRNPDITSKNEKRTPKIPETRLAIPNELFFCSDIFYFLEYIRYSTPMIVITRTYAQKPCAKFPKSRLPI